jgi:hypothetical protein
VCRARGGVGALGSAEEGDANPRSPVCSELGAPGRRADTTHLAIVRPGTPIVSRRRARASDFRMPGAPFAWTKAGLELEIGFGDSSIWRRLFFAGKYRFFCSILMTA